MPNEEMITYKQQLQKVSVILLQESIDEDDKYYLSLFAMDLCNMQLLYNNNIINYTDIEMQRNLQLALQLLQTAFQNNNTPSKYFIDVYSRYLTQRNQNSTISTPNQAESNGSSNENAKVRVLHNAQFSGSFDNDTQDFNQNGIAGYGNIILILLFTIVFGVFLASLLL